MTDVLEGTRESVGGFVFPFLAVALELWVAAGAAAWLRLGWVRGAGYRSGVTVSVFVAIVLFEWCSRCARRVAFNA